MSLKSLFTLKPMSLPAKPKEPEIRTLKEGREFPKEIKDIKEGNEMNCPKCGKKLYEDGDKTERTVIAVNSLGTYLPKEIIIQEEQEFFCQDGCQTAVKTMEHKSYILNEVEK